MMHSVLVTLLAAATISAPAAPAGPAHANVAHAARSAHGTAMVKVWTDWEEYYRGQEATVHLRLRDDGYVIVMQADVDGRVRVIFPLDPGDDNFLRGGHDINLPGRGGKETFYVDGPAGTSFVYAAVSSVPFHFNEFVQGDHWDYGSLYDKSLDNDFENGFTALVNRMSAGHFDYDVYRFRVIGQTSYAADGGYGPPVAGSPCWATPWNPWCYGPNWLPGPYYGGAGPWWPGYADPWGGFYAGFGWGYGFGFGVGFGVPIYGGCGYYCGAYYGGGYYGGGYYGRPYYPYYGGGYYPYYGGTYRGYTYKAGNPGGVGVTGVGYRPRVPVTVAGGFGTPYRTPTAHSLPTLGSPAGIERRTPGTRTGYTLGRGGGRFGPTMDPHRGDGGSGYRRTSTSEPSPRGGGAQPPPRYQPGTGSEPRGRASPGSGATGSVPSPRAPSAPSGHPPSAPSGHPPSAPAPRSGGNAPASHPSSPPAHSGGGGRRVP